jgi:hypothetical protein
MGIFQRIPGTDSKSGLDHGLARQVVQAYANFLNAAPPLPGCVADTSELPFDKELIKESLSTWINTTGDPELIEHFKHGYLMLSAWQDNVGERRLGVDFTAIDLDADPLTIASEVQRRNDEVAYWTPIVAADQKQLAADLLAFGV